MMFVKINLTPLSEDKGSFYITNRVPFKRKMYHSNEDVESCLEFAYNMSYLDKGHMKNRRSGGEILRNNGNLFCNIFDGKLAEFAVANLMNELSSSNMAKPDLEVKENGNWNCSDLSTDGININISSSSKVSNLLLLECKDWTQEGRYRHCKSNEDNIDFFVFVRFDEKINKLLSDLKLAYKNVMSRSELEEIKKRAMSVKWYYDIVGYITQKDLIDVIKSGFVLKKGSSLNGSTIIDADNYYIQVNDLRNINTFVDAVNIYKDRKKAVKKVNNIDYSNLADNVETVLLNRYLKETGESKDSITVVNFINWLKSLENNRKH